MTTVRRITTSQIEGDSANNTNDTEIRPFGETAFYIDDSGEGNKLTLMMFDGVRNHRDSKVLQPGAVFGSNADAGDGSNADTIKLIPSAFLYGEGSDQYVVVDPTGGEPGHIHLRAGGTQDDSTADLYLGGELTCVRISDTSDNIVIRTTNIGDPNTTFNWTFNNSGYLTLPTGGTLGAEGMGWTGLSNGTAGTPVSVLYKDGTGYPQAAITFGGGDNLTGEGSIIIDAYNAAAQTGYQWIFNANGSITLPGSSVLDSADSNVEIRTTNNFNVEAQNVVNIVTASQTAAHQWQFEDAGELTLPAGTIIDDVSTAGVTLKVRTAPVTIVITGADFVSVNLTYTRDFGQVTPTWYPAGYIPGTDSYIEFSGGQYKIFNPGFGQALYVNTGTFNNPLEQWSINPPLGSVPPTGNYTYSSNGSSWTFDNDGVLTLPGGSTVRDLPGETANDSLLILGAGATIEENIRAARIGINGAVEGVSIGAGSNDWTFTNDGTLTLPGGMTVETEYGGTPRLVIDGKANHVDIRSDNAVLIGYNESSGNVYIGKPTGGGQVDILGSKFRVMVDVPASSTGNIGDQSGQVAVDGSYIYYCTQNFGGTTYNVVHNIAEGFDANGVDNGYLVANSYQLPQVGWKVYYNGQVRTIDQVNNGGIPGFYVVFVDSALTIPGQATFAWGPAPATNIWKRVAWSGDTW